MSHPLIFTERSVLPKLIDSLLTLIAWVGFIWLIYHGVVSVLYSQPVAGTQSSSPTLATLLFYLLVALFNTLLFIIWAKYNQLRFSTERRTRRQGLADDQLAIHFGLTEEHLEQLNQAQIAVIHYDNDGIILDVSVKRSLTAV